MLQIPRPARRHELRQRLPEVVIEHDAAKTRVLKIQLGETLRVVFHFPHIHERAVRVAPGVIPLSLCVSNDGAEDIVHQRGACFVMRRYYSLEGGGFSFFSVVRSHLFYVSRSIPLRIPPVLRS